MAARRTPAGGRYEFSRVKRATEGETVCLPKGRQRKIYIYIHVYIRASSYALFVVPPRLSTGHCLFLPRIATNCGLGAASIKRNNARSWPRARLASQDSREKTPPVSSRREKSGTINENVLRCSEFSINVAGVDGVPSRVVKHARRGLGIAPHATPIAFASPFALNDA